MASRNRQLVWRGLCDIDDVQERIAAVHFLLAADPDALRRPDRSGDSALETFVSSNDAILVCYLLRLGASPDGLSAHCPSPIHTAVYLSGGNEILCALIAAGADLDGTLVWTPLWEAILSGRLDRAELLLANGCSVDRLCEDGETALWLAVCRKDVAACALLMKYGADPSIRETRGGRSPRDLVPEIANADVRVRLTALFSDAGEQARSAPPTSATPAPHSNSPTETPPNRP